MAEILSIPSQSNLIPTIRQFWQLVQEVRINIILCWNIKLSVGMCCEEGVGRPEPDSPLNYDILNWFFCSALLDTGKDIALCPGYGIPSACFCDTEVALSWRWLRSNSGKYLEENLSLYYLLHLKLTWTHPGTNKDLRDERQVTKFLNPEKANLNIKFN